MSLRGLGDSKPIPGSLAAWEPILGSSAYPMSLKKSLILYMVEGRSLMNMVSFRNFWKLVSCLLSELKELLCRRECFTSL